MMEQDPATLDTILHTTSSLWVFGYGSILWKTGFHYERKKIGYITGYARRFWQGSTSHRGTPQNPGRVATLVPAHQPLQGEEGIDENHDGCVWGAAYELVGKDMIVEALDHLGVRECLLGGYISIMTPFFERSSPSQSESPAPISVLMFTATEANELFLGPAASMDALAAQIISCRGPCGHNIQYVTRLANYMREHVPEERDPHLYGLMACIEAQLERQGLDMEALIDDAKVHAPSVSSVCAKCNALCSEYAFCNNCRHDAIKDALTCGDAASTLHKPPITTTTAAEVESPPTVCSTSEPATKSNSTLAPRKSSPAVRRKQRGSFSESCRRTEIAVASQ